MPRHQSLIALLPITLLSACGTNPQPYNFSGNWSASSQSQSPVNYYAVARFAGVLNVSDGVVTGTFSSTVYVYDKYIGGSYVDVACPESNQPVTGTLDGNNNLSISVPVTQGGVATITGTLSDNPQTLITGSYTVAGGPCSVPATPISIAEYAPVTGSYSGNFSLTTAVTNVPIPGTNSSVTAVLTQSDTADTYGQFPLTGTVTLAGACNDTMQISGGGAGNAITGYSVSNPSILGLGGTIDPTATTLTGYFRDLGSTNPNCTQLSSGILTRQ
jgi:hypothetical protein